VSKGDRLLVMEAMKMQSAIYAPVAGNVTQKAGERRRQSGTRKIS